MHVLCKIVFFMCKTLIEQAHPAPFFCKITFRRSKYFLEISKARERLMTVASKTFGVFFLRFSGVVFFPFITRILRLVSLKRSPGNFSIKIKPSLESSNEGKATSFP